MSRVADRLRPPPPAGRGGTRVLWAGTDWGLVIAALGLSLVGAALVWSATRHRSGDALAVRHLVNTAIGVALAVVITRIDVRGLRAWAPWLYLAGVAGLLLVLSPLGSTINGSRSWIELPGGFSVQPAELAKLSLCVGLAMILAEGRAGERRDRAPAHRDAALAWFVAGIPIGLILLQPDLGSALVLGALALGVVTVSGAAARWSWGVVLLAAAGIVAALTLPLLDGYQRDRILAFADPDLDPQGIGYQTRQVRLAIASGGWTGQGLFAGGQTQGGFIPFQETDFVFSVAGEELGFVGAGVVVAVLGFIILRALLIALRADDGFSRLVAAGVACWFGFQAFENIGMNLGLMPVTGLPLPFLSYGGSSMFACWAAIGLLNTAQLGPLRRAGPGPAGPARPPSTNSASPLFSARNW